MQILSEKVYLQLPSCQAPFGTTWERTNGQSTGYPIEQSNGCPVKPWTEYSMATSSGGDTSDEHVVINLDDEEYLKPGENYYFPSIWEDFSANDLGRPRISVEYLTSFEFKNYYLKNVY